MYASLRKYPLGTSYTLLSRPFELAGIPRTPFLLLVTAEQKADELAIEKARRLTR
jgi:hypothetical protein